MKKTIMFLIALMLFTSLPSNLVAEDTVESPCYFNESNKECVQRLVNIYAKKYKVSAKSMMRTLENENNTFDFDRQSGLKYKKNNRWGLSGYEQSYGIAQIHLPDHPSVTKEEAINPEFAIEFMAKNFAQGKQKMWMGYEK